MSTNNINFRLELYRQSWQQSRHNETLRVTYTAFVAAIVVGVLAFSGDEQNRLHSLSLLLAVLSFSVFMISLRTWLTTKRWLVTHRKIQRDLKLSQYVQKRPFFDQSIWCPLRFIDPLIRFDITFNLLGLVATSFFIAMNVMSFSFSEGFSAVWPSDYIVVVAILVIMVVLWGLVWRHVKYYDASSRFHPAQATYPNQ